MPLVRAIFFDIGDTLIFDDPPLPERVRRAMRQVGLTVDPSAFPATYRVGESYAITEYLKGRPWEDPAVARETMRRLFAALDLTLDDARWAVLAEAFAKIGFRRILHPQVLPLLAELKARGVTLGVISDWEGTLPALLEDLGVLKFLDALAVSATVGVTKPHRRMFEAALSQAGVRPEEALHVGDWYELDIDGARAAGMQALLFDHAARRPDADGPRVTTFDQLRERLLAVSHYATPN